MYNGKKSLLGARKLMIILVKIGTTPQKNECLISIPDEGYSRDVHTKLDIYTFSIL
jgi:hypothetical protein